MLSRPTLSPLVTCTAFITPLLLQLLVTFADGVSAVSPSTIARTQSVTPLHNTSQSHNSTRLLQTTWPAIRGRTTIPLPPFPQSTLMPTNPRDRSPTAGPPLQRSTTFPGVLTSLRVIRVITSGIPIPNSPSLRPIGSTAWPPLTSAPVFIAGGDVIHCQLKLANGYREMLNASGSSRHIYGRELGAGIARLCRVDETRISDVNVFENPETGLMVLRFNINPAVTSCRLGCSLNTSRVAETAESLVNSFSFNLSDISSQTLYVDQLPAFYSWSDDGPCPSSACPVGDVCNVHLSGEFFCQCVRDCATKRTTDPLNSALWALSVIPFVIIIILLVLLILLVYRRRQNVSNKIAKKTVRDYQPVYDIETLKQQPMLATLDPGAANQLFKSLESQLGVAFNDRSFDNTSSCGDNLVSPLSTIRVNTTSTTLRDEEDV